ncbi:uncharacterized protein BO95DRAFT_88621 [Aspergillus brunneoviolaceus CBS 621.78]|uniref:Uncharacterized protein n=1 Tax=Aspergillus brunneoviolaceus CBS 621.78 TaxID=1450534 RepID=A0ACD1GDY8_9EURO|nr:hypothetical protein BO95DRAFT_88621 [Aspergillus brunneoviolaceus CBS 621.78]RAH47311.1 hypothetical protein BO95DRAFT_88621 [Aspergillus brunneoviolaceus CBS 621.78]
MSSDKMSSDKMSSEKMSSEKASSDKMSSERMRSDDAITDNMPSHEKSNEAALDEKATDKQASSPSSASTHPSSPTHLQCLSSPVETPSLSSALIFSAGLYVTKYHPRLSPDCVISFVSSTALKPNHCRTERISSRRRRIKD